MSNDCSSVDSTDRDALLTAYEQYREEVRAHGQRKSRRYVGSLTVLAAIAGYLFSTGDARILAAVPFVLAFLYASHVSSMDYVVQLAALLALIEAEIDRPGLEYEYYHGGFAVTTNPRFTDVDWRATGTASLKRRPHDEARNVMALLAVGAYAATACAGWFLIVTTGIPAVGIEPSSLLSLTPATAIGYFVLCSQAILLWWLAAAWRSYWHNRWVLAAGVENAVDDHLVGVGSLERAAGAD